MKATEKAGKVAHGSSWQTLDWISMLMFHTILIQMAMTVKPNVYSYFEKGSSIANLSMSRRRFCDVYTILKTYDKEEVEKSKRNKKSVLESYDSLWKCRDLWNKTIVNFQRMRNPPQFLSLDESMSKYKVKAR